MTPKTLLIDFLQKASSDPNPYTLNFLSQLTLLWQNDPASAKALMKELEDQRLNLKLIASENYSSLAVQAAMGNWLTDKYAEGFPMRRFYAGCENVDQIEALAAERACKLFEADHAFVQPHSGADANLLAFMAILLEKVQNPWVEKLAVKGVDGFSAQDFESMRQSFVNQKVLGMSLNSGGHLTHGYRMNISSRLMQSVQYEVEPETQLIDYEKLRKQALEQRPLILLAGYSAYPRRLNFAKMREIADEAGAVLMADMAHFAGLVAGKVFSGEENPVEYAHIVTTTTHKTLRGPRGGLVLCKKEFAASVNKACPLMMGGPLPHVMNAKAIAFKEALEPSFSDYTQQICKNAKALCEGMMKRGHQLWSKGTDNHLMVVEVHHLGLTGKQAESILRSVGITVNRNSIPYDPQGPWLTSGVRLGTAALTTLGMKEAEMDQVAHWIDTALRHAKADAQDKSLASLDEAITSRIRQEIQELKSKYPLYPEIPSLVPCLSEM
jgi:glycine hydroxymethyltransferase